MRRVLTITTIACYALSVAGCSKKSDASGEAEPHAQASAAAAASSPEADTKTAASAKPAQAELDGKVALHPRLSNYVGQVLPKLDEIPDERKKQLGKVADFVKKQVAADKTAKLTFICTHNSRRSHLSQLWAATAAAYYGVDRVETFSGGTEATAFNPRAVAAVERAGFQVKNPGGENPHYKVSFAEDATEQECFSKKYDDPFNPKEDFAAIMTCSQADKSCPNVKGASLRVPIPYVDPKEADDTPEEAARYDERSRQIATEMFYLFRAVQA